MNILIYIFYITVSASAISSIKISPQTIKNTFNLFKRHYQRHYLNKYEENFRKDIFKRNLLEIESHNKKYQRGLTSYKIELNNFSDMTPEELQRLTSDEPQIPVATSLYVSPALFSSFSESFDWRSFGALNNVKNQGNCGSCWAFADIAAIESHYKIQHNTSVVLSEQQLVDCVTGSGCGGGYKKAAMKYIVNNGGVNLDSDYPYEAQEGPCRFREEKPLVMISGYASLPKDSEESLKEVIATIGPVVVSIGVEGNFYYYKSGIYYSFNCNVNKTNHAVVVVGYGRENEEDFWIVRNSWGAHWGDEGYIKMSRNRGNNCQIASFACWPIL